MPEQLRYYRSEIDPREVVCEVRSAGGWAETGRYWPVAADLTGPGIPPELVGVEIEEA
jgi:hypothetical protein